jgi:hypothetical protein
MIRIITDTTVTTMEAGIMVMGVVMGEEEGIGTTIQMDVMRIVATTVVQIVLGEVGAVVVGVGGVSRLPLSPETLFRESPEVRSLRLLVPYVLGMEPCWQ